MPKYKVGDIVSACWTYHSTTSKGNQSKTFRIIGKVLRVLPHNIYVVHDILVDEEAYFEENRIRKTTPLEVFFFRLLHLDSL